MGSFDRSLSFSFGAVVLVLMAVFLSVAALLSFQIQERRQDFLATALAQAVGESVNRVNAYQMRGLVEDLQQKIPGLGYLAVADRAGVLLAHSRPNLVSKTLEQAGLKPGDQADFIWEDSHYWQRALPLIGGLGEDIVGTILVGVATDDLRHDQAWFLGSLALLSLAVTLAAVGTVLLLSRRFAGQVVAQLDLILEKSPVGMVTADLESGRVLRANEKFSSVYGWKLGDLPTITSWFERAYPEPEYRRAVMRLWAEAVAESQVSGRAVPPLEARMLCADGKERVVMIAAALVDKTAVVTFVDRTEQKAAEKALVELNHSLEEKVRSRGEELERTYRELVDTEKLAALGQLAAGMAHELNTPLGAIQSANGLNLEYLTQGLGPALQRLRTFDTNQLAFFLELSARGEHLQGTPQLTDRKARRELAARLQDLGWDADEDLVEYALELDLDDPTLERLAASLDWQSVLRLSRDLVTLARMTRVVAEGAEKAAHVVAALQRYLKGRDEDDLVRFVVADQIETLLTLFHHKVKHGVEVVLDLDRDAVVVGDRQRLNQVWMNLIHNALQAMEFRGTLAVRVRRVGGSVEVEVSDTGSGIPEAIQDRIFEPYFTTKKRGEGLGLGLDLCRKILLDHQGTIAFASRPGSTRFTVTLPASQES